MTAGPSGRTKVLFVSGLQVHPTFSGGTLRTFALANALAHHGFQVAVYSFVGRKRDYLAWRRSSWQTWPEGTEEFVNRGWLGFVAQYGSWKLALPSVWLTGYLRAAGTTLGSFLVPRVLREQLAWADVIVSDFPFVHPVFDLPAAGKRLRVLSTHNLEHRMHDDTSRWLNRHLQPLVRGIELRAAARADVVVSCCDTDREYFEQNAPVKTSVLVPNGIDPARFQGLQAQRAPTRQALGIDDDTRVFLFTASRYGPNREAFDFLVAFARAHAELLMERRIHLLVMGSVTAEPLRLPGLTATGRVEAAEPYFAAADAALNPMALGAGTNVKMCEYLATHLPILTTPFGTRGFRIEDGRTGFLFERGSLAGVLSAVRGLFDADAPRLRRMAQDAYAENRGAIDMDACVESLVRALNGATA